MTAATPDLSRLPDDDLPRLWGEVMEEMLRRGIVSSRNSPTADIAERVVAEHLNAKLAPRNTAGYDLKTGSKRIQVKAVRLGGRGSYLSAIRSKDFDSVVVVVFDPVLRVQEILQMDKATAAACWRRSDHVNGYLLSLQKIRNHPNTKPIKVKKKWQR